MSTEWKRGQKRRELREGRDREKGRKRQRPEDGTELYPIPGSSLFLRRPVVFWGEFRSFATEAERQNRQRRRNRREKE